MPHFQYPFFPTLYKSSRKSIKLLGALSLSLKLGRELSLLLFFRSQAENEETAKQGFWKETRKARFLQGTERSAWGLPSDSHNQEYGGCLPLFGGKKKLRVASSNFSQDRKYYLFQHNTLGSDINIYTLPLWRQQKATGGHKRIRSFEETTIKYFNVHIV